MDCRCVPLAVATALNTRAAAMMPGTCSWDCWRFRSRSDGVAGRSFSFGRKLTTPLCSSTAVWTWLRSNQPLMRQ